MNITKLVKNGYIVGLGVNSGGTEISDNEYAEINHIIRNRPDAPKGYAYRLRDDLSWEIYAIPEPELKSEPATENDYIAMLRELGVDV